MLTIASRCWLCQCPLHLAIQGICSLCLRHLPAAPPCCPRCGLPGTGGNLDCGRCLQHPPPWDALVFASPYEPPVSGLVLRLKFAHLPELDTTLARLFLLRWLARWRSGNLQRPDILLSVPLHQKRYFSRGYNQSELLARPLARWLHCEYRPYALSRDRQTVPQQSLSERERKWNLRKAFSCHADLHGKNVMLLDDVVTTGSTVREISKMLINQGVNSVQIACICRTLQT
ncbi:DNA utilization protein GntX [Rahnella sp. PD12R]|uniref:DNA utilization protein GntX n=1 Tax=Rahnella sp. PD12R TaxID=2855688 RepID=UPI001C453D41|nr:DNA utilization protein GntX [Rahnella sp. PD12R]MBV6818761.1 DNA utilization protein GntX [Rahnella sp. PD12R]